jgi:cell division protein FtsW
LNFKFASPLRTFLHEHNADHVLSLIIFGLVIAGIALVSSASLDTSYRIFEKTGQENYYLWHQLQSAFIAVIFWIIGQAIHYTFWKKSAPVILGLSILGLILVFVPGIKAEYGTSNSWIYLPVIGSFQPIEFSKLALIIYFASWFQTHRSNIKSFVNGTLPFGLLLLSHLILMALQPDFGSMEVIILTATAMFFIAGANLNHFISVGSVSAMVLFYIAYSFTYIQKRFLSFLDPSIDPEGIGYHIKQALIAVGSGGWWGLGFGYSRQKFNYLPEAQGDSIFAVISEEMGFFRSAIIILLYLLILYKGISIARRSEDIFAKYLAFGICIWIVIQAFINMAVNLSLAPITGITLPLLSYGGSSLIITLFYVGILLNISKYTSETVQDEEVITFNLSSRKI